MTRSRPKHTPTPTPERCRIGPALGITGLGQRQMQAMSARGEIPGAAKLGGTWTYDIRKLRQWVREKETLICQAISTSAGTSGGRESKYEGTTLDEAYERLLS